jgi:phenylacetate-CoA ligase
MIASLLRRILPDPAVKPLRRLASVVPWPWRMGQTYWHWTRTLQAARAWPPETVRAWQLEQLRNVVRHAYERTEGYRELYRQAGIHPEDIRRLEDVRHLPFTTKRLFQDNLEAFSDRRLRRDYVTTGGSTGIPFGFYQTAVHQEIENAFMHSAWAAVGWNPRQVSAVLRGAFIGSAEKPWNYDHYGRVLELSSYYLTDKTLGVYRDAINRYRPQVLQAYPSSLQLLCTLLRPLPPAKRASFALILLGSENVYDWQLEQVREVFPAATVFAWYGHAERVLFAPWCAKRRAFHVAPLYGLPELLDDNDREVNAGEVGELVGTSFHNFATPFIRYRTMDRAVRGPSSCDRCGHDGMMLECVVGRSHEIILTATGRRISMTAINMHDDIFDALRQFQFYQEELGRVVFRYVSKQPLSDRHRRTIHDRLMVKLGGDVDLSLAAVDEIPRTRAGKLSFLDQRLPMAEAAFQSFSPQLEETRS